MQFGLRDALETFQCEFEVILSVRRASHVRFSPCTLKKYFIVAEHRRTLRARGKGFGIVERGLYLSKTE